MPGFSLAPLDLGIIAAYFVAVMVIGFRVAGRTKSDEDLFLAGRTLGWPAIGFSLFASNISSTTLTFSRASTRDGLAGLPGWADYRWQMVALVALTVIIVVTYW